ncbi:hypothetical protein HKI87_15g81300 [Chloropicon roscoffensis]|uniref:Uncharacterized protein n=1 Tax=Chloropicon roscoffensis TaxID=1461544 RepID=A0AAX4PJU0_9CHLO
MDNGGALPGLSPLSPTPLSPSSVQVLDEATTNVERRIEEFDLWYRNRKRVTPTKTGAGLDPKMSPLDKPRSPLRNRTNETQSREGEKGKEGVGGARAVLFQGAKAKTPSRPSPRKPSSAAPQRSPALIDLATPLPRNQRQQGTPDWVRELSRHQQQQQEEEPPMDATPPAPAPGKDAMSEVMSLLDEKTQECRELYAMMKRLDEDAKRGGTKVGAEVGGGVGHHGVVKALPQRHHPRHRRQPAAEASTSDHPRPPPAPDAPGAELLVSKLEALLAEAKGGAEASGGSTESEAAALRRENAELRRENELLVERCHGLQRDLDGAKRDQRDCLEAVRKADRLILQVLKAQQQPGFQ